MCGIAGVYNPGGVSPEDVRALGPMTRALAHRGPDDEGFYHDRFVALGHRRLSIIDLSGGAQPMRNEDGSVWVVFNGEIFNYIELMDLLKKKGHRFRTRSDTETLVHLYEEYGESFLEKVNGQFAIALWDTRGTRLLLARDRMGIRPLYYYRLDNGALAFGSEIKALGQHPHITLSFDPIGLEQALTLWAPVPPRTVYSGVNEVQPGEVVSASASLGVCTSRYWRLQFPRRGDYKKESLSFYTERLRELLDDAVAVRLRADVPVAAYLSGGLDSSIISSFVKRKHNNDLITFSVAFSDQAYDERLHQERMVRYLKTDHRMIETDYEQIGRVFDSVIRFAEYPTLRTAPAPLYMLSGLVRENGVKVVLTGEGADEVFGGYNIFKEERLRRFWARQPGSRLRPLLLQRLYPYIQRNEQTRMFWSMFFRQGLEDTNNPYYSHMIRWNNTAQIQRFLSPAMRAQLNPLEHVYEELNAFLPEEFAGWDPLCRAQFLEMRLFMSGYLLSTQGDRMMMGHSVEGRFPFLDHRLVEFAATVPPSYKINGLNEKYLVKKAFADTVPSEIIARNKQPYRAPVAQCFTPNNDHPAAAMLSEEHISRSDLFDPSSVTRLAAKLRDTSQSLSAREDMAVAAIVSLQLIDADLRAQFSRRQTAMSDNRRMKTNQQQQ